MPRFFVPSAQIVRIDDGSAVTINVTVRGEDAHHISHSLRMAVGDEVIICPQDGPDAGLLEYRCRINHFCTDAVTAQAGLNDVSLCCTEPPYFARLFVALSKADKMETVVQKAVECGVGEIIPFVSSRCVARPAEGEPKKQQRRGRIAAEAAKQCGRGVIPHVAMPVSFSAMLKEAARADLSLFFYEGEGTLPLPRLLDCPLPPRPEIALIIGAEGGFSPDEVEEARAVGLNLAGLGPRILRCETAPIYALSALSYAYELADARSDDAEN